MEKLDTSNLKWQKFIVDNISFHKMASVCEKIESKHMKFVSLDYEYPFSNQFECFLKIKEFGIDLRVLNENEIVSAIRGTRN